MLHVSLQTAPSKGENTQFVFSIFEGEEGEDDVNTTLFRSLKIGISFACSQARSWEEGGDDVKSAWPFDTLGDTRATMADNKGLPTSDGELISKTRSQFGLQAATRLHEAGITSNRESATSR